MFLGHFGLALAAKRVAPQTSFGTALLATEFADCLWPLFLTLGMEQVRIAPGITRMTPLDFVSYPWSHSLLMDCVWAAGFALLYFAMRRYRAGAWVVAAGVLSHWVLDWLSHRPDMPISPWSQQKYGLGLWNSVAGTVVVELGLFFGGLATYLMSTRARDGVGKFALWSFVILIIFIWVGAVFGPPPPSVNAVRASGFALWLAVAWAYWIERHRKLALSETR
jgi:LexA-binding, inner membrane-associated putative hydrolase